MEKCLNAKGLSLYEGADKGLFICSSLRKTAKLLRLDIFASRVSYLFYIFDAGLLHELRFPWVGQF